MPLSQHHVNMPCPDCGALLYTPNSDARILLCPRCNGQRVESQAVVNAKTNWYLKDYLPENRINGLLTQFRKLKLTYTLISRLNLAAHEFLSDEQAGLPANEFGYIAYILDRVYEINDSQFGTDTFDQDTGERSEEIEAVREYYTEFVERLEFAQNRFSVCIRNEDYSGRMEDFPSDYTRYMSEYGVCFDRCSDSIGGDPEYYEEFSYVQDEIRRISSIDTEDAETPREFADAWYQYIQQMRFIAGADERIGPTYYTEFPEGVTVFDIDAFLDALDQRLSPEIHDRIAENGFVPPFSPDHVDECGRQVFGDAWPSVREHVVVSEENRDAHPLLFEVTFPHEQETPDGRTVSTRTTNVFYPRTYAQLLKFQVFPMLQNGDGVPDGHTLLTDVAGDRGDERERTLYEFLTEEDVRCYHSAEITKQNPNEIDLLCVFDDRVLFIEVKYLFPPIGIKTRDGIRVLDEKFNRLIFNEVPPDSDRTAEGKPFPEKVAAWRDLDDGEAFSAQAGPAEGNDEFQLPDRWGEFDVDKFVVSNLVPSFIEKNGVRFVTDFEFYRHIKYEDSDVLYSVAE